jgi:hypothetical protein
MSEIAPPSGWVVQVTTPGKPSLTRSISGRLSSVLGAPSFEYFNVAIDTPDAAVAATTKQLTEGSEGEARVVRALSSKEIAALSLKPGQVAPA